MEPFQPHPNLGKEINDFISEAELQGGLWLKDIPLGTTILIQTKHSQYQVEHRAEDEWFISGNQRFCVTPIKCRIHGSTWGGSSILSRFIGRGMFLEFSTEEHHRIVTSEIQEITEDKS